MKNICQIIGATYEDIQRELSREPMKGRKSLIQEWNLKQE